jgi:hypothetical protein
MGLEKKLKEGRRNGEDPKQMTPREFLKRRLARKDNNYGELMIYIFI